MEQGVAALPAVDGRFPQISGFTMTVNSGTLPAGSRVTDIRQRVAQLRRRAIVAAARSSHRDAPQRSTSRRRTSPPAAVTATRSAGMTYDFAHAPGTTALYPYQASLFDFITTPVADGGLGGVVTSAALPAAAAGSRSTA